VPVRAANADEPAGGTKASNEADNAKKVGIGVDAAAIVPVGEFSDATGPLLGATVRLGYDLTPRFQAFVRGGYQFGTPKDTTQITGVNAQGFTHGPATVRLDVIPVYVGGRYFAMKPRSGLYGDLELGVNIFEGHTTVTTVSSSATVISSEPASRSSAPSQAVPSRSTTWTRCRFSAGSARLSLLRGSTPYATQAFSRRRANYGHASSGKSRVYGKVAPALAPPTSSTSPCARAAAIARGLSS
jgi:hypothetical protein